MGLRLDLVLPSKDSVSHLTMGFDSVLTERLTLFIVEVALLDAISKALQGSRLVRVRTVNKYPGVLTLEGKPEVDVRAETVWNIDQTELIELVIDLWKGVLKHVFLTLKNS